MKRVFVDVDPPHGRRIYLGQLLAERREGRFVVHMAFNEFARVWNVFVAKHDQPLFHENFVFGLSEAAKEAFESATEESLVKKSATIAAARRGPP